MEDFVEILEGLKRGSCFCEMAVGNPMVREHTEACNRAMKFLKDRKKQVVVISEKMAKELEDAGIDVKESSGVIVDKLIREEEIDNEPRIGEVD